MSRLGLILTHAPDVAWLARQVELSHADILKVVSGWGMNGGWTERNRAEVARLAPALLVRTVAGDPSAYGGEFTLPVSSRVAEEIRPWWSVRDPARPFIIEIGNEPLIAPQATDELAWVYRWALKEAIKDCRREFPGAQILGPAQLINHPIRLGDYPDGATQFTAICADVLRLCDGLSLHAYTAEQLTRGKKMLRDLVSGHLPLWATELNLNVSLKPDERGRALASLLDNSGLEAGLLYHLVHAPGSDPIHFNPNYTLHEATLSALRAAREMPVATPSPTSDPETIHYPNIREDGFALAVIQFRTVAALRRHLSRYNFRQTAPWAKGVVIHHSYRPIPADWRGTKSIASLARFYRREVDNGPGQPKGGWTSGPHLFVVSGAPNPLDDGIWQFTPLNLPGTHARAANSGFWGIEHVGDFTRAPMPPDTAALGLGAAAALLDWAGLPTSTTTVTPHSQWGKPECPGAAVDMGAVRRAVAALRLGSL